MRLLGGAAAVITLIAATVGIATLTAFGFDWWEILKILVPMGAAVALVSWIIFRLGVQSAEWLNREEKDEDPYG